MYKKTNRALLWFPFYLQGSTWGGRVKNAIFHSKGATEAPSNHQLVATKNDDDDQPLAWKLSPFLIMTPFTSTLFFSTQIDAQWQENHRRIALLMYTYHTSSTTPGSNPTVCCWLVGNSKIAYPLISWKWKGSSKLKWHFSYFKGPLISTTSN